VVPVRLEVVGAQRLACETCERRVERMLRALPGVAEVRAHARQQRIDVLFDPAAIDQAALMARLGEAGYETRTGP